MAKLEGPLFSMGASGSIGPRLTYSKRKSGHQVRVQKAQTDALSAEQVVERGYYEDAIAAWATLTDNEKSQWTDFNKS